MLEVSVKTEILNEALMFLVSVKTEMAHEILMLEILMFAMHRFNMILI